ncbi:MAG TPA: urate hydroxylase PuuD [Terriglobales bacterium]|jgi:uncharacterized membrane protein
MHYAAVLFSSGFHPPTDFNTNFLMLVRWIHFLAGITWLGLLYFFTLVNVPLMSQLDSATKGKVFPALMSRALWWFRWAAVVTVLMGLAYWGNIVAADAHNAQASSGMAMSSFFLIWTVVWALLYALLIPGKGVLNNGWVLGPLVAVIVIAAAWLFLSLNDHGWESNRLLSIGIGGGLGWVMLLNVWGVIWRIQKRIILWTKDSAENGTPVPEKASRMARMSFLCSRINACLSLPLLFFMAAASHYPMFGK